MVLTLLVHDSVYTMVTKVYTECDAMIGLAGRGMAAHSAAAHIGGSFPPSKMGRRDWQRADSSHSNRVSGKVLLYKELSSALLLI